MNQNPKNNILMFENIRQKRLTILKYFDVYNDEKYIHQNISELLVFLSDIF